MVLFIETESADEVEKPIILNTIAFDKDAEGKDCALVYIKRKALPRQSVNTFQQQVESSLTGEDRENFIFAYSGDSEVITIGVHYNPHAHRDLYRKIGAVVKSIKKYTGIQVTIDMSTFPK